MPKEFDPIDRSAGKPSERNDLLRVTPRTHAGILTESVRIATSDRSYPITVEDTMANNFLPAVEAGILNKAQMVGRTSSLFRPIAKGQLESVISISTFGEGLVQATPDATGARNIANVGVMIGAPDFEIVPGRGSVDVKIGVTDHATVIYEVGNIVYDQDALFQTEIDKEVQHWGIPAQAMEKKGTASEEGDPPLIRGELSDDQAQVLLLALRESRQDIT